MADSSRLPERSTRPRVATPITPPVLLPSLIPYDVIQDYKREVARAQVEATALEQALLDAEMVSDDDIEEVVSGDEDVAVPVEAARRDEEQTAEAPVVPEPDIDIEEPLREQEEVLSESSFMTKGPADRSLALGALDQVSLFHGLPASSMEAMADAALQHQLPTDELLFVEGDPASSFFVVVEGTIEVLRQKDGREVALRHIGRGEAIGLFGLFSAQMRAASARAIGDVTVIEVPSEKLQAILERDDALHNRLLSFYRERILEGFVGSSRLFVDVDSIARARTIGRFVQKNIAASETLLMPGEVANMLLIVTHGTLLVEERAVAGKEQRQFEVTDGQFLAITAAISGNPSRMRVYTDSQASVVMLGHRELNELLRDYPALRNLPQRLPQHSRQLDRDVFCGLTGVPGL